MDLKNLKILEKAADILKELNFSDKELQEIYAILVGMFKTDFQRIDTSLFTDIKDDNKPEIIFKRLIEFIGNSGKVETFQQFLTSLVNNKDLLDYIQNLAIEKIKDNLLKSNF